jgi:glycogen(starch) synthase
MVGGLGRHVHALATTLARAGHDVTVATRHAPGAPLEEMVDGVRVVRAPQDPPVIPLDTEHLLAWAVAFNHTLTRTALHAAGGGGFELVHAHDWLVAHAAVTVKDHLGIPLVATIHATEAGRHQGWLPGDLNRGIHSIECWLAQEASRVLVCSQYMRREVSALLGVPASKIHAIPNGVDAPRWRAEPKQVHLARAKYAGSGPLVGFAGRLVHEKGVQHLLHALPELRRAHPGLRAVICGDGPNRGELEDLSRRLGLEQTVRFGGFLGPQLSATMAATDAMVVPSLYEPFGMVALEAAAAGAPLAVAATGGLAEIVEPGVTGVTFPARDENALARSVSTLLADPSGARRMVALARAMVRRRYGWPTVGEQTAAVYAAAVDGAPQVPPGPEQLWLSRQQPISIPEGNLLASAGLAA